VTATSLPIGSRRASWRRKFDRLLVRDGLTRGELLVFLLIQTVATGLLLFQHIVKSGFYSDDYSYQATFRYEDHVGGFWHAFHYTEHSGPLLGRPLLAVYLTLIEWAFGDHPERYLIWAAILAIVFSVVVYLALRSLRMRPVDAGMIALFVLVFPASDSTRIWSIISDAQVAMSFVVLGVCCRMKSFTLQGRAQFWWRVLALALVVIGMITYELTFVAMLLVGVLYLTRVSWRRALVEVVIDWIVLAMVYALVLSHSTATRLSTSQTIDHGWTIVKQSVTLYTSTALPFRSTAAGLAVTGLIIVAAVFFTRTLEAEDPVRRQLRWWLVAIGIAFVILVGAYAEYAPSATYYVPLATGEESRTNAFAALPMLIIVYGLCILTGTMVFRSLGQGRTATVAVLALTVSLGIGYTVKMAGDLRLWDSAYNRAQQTLTAFRAQEPRLPRNALVVFYGQPIEEVYGIPVWAHLWDLTAALELAYKDHSIRGRAGFSGSELICHAKTAQFTNQYSPSGLALPSDHTIYGKIFLYNSVTNVVNAPQNRAQCVTDSAALAASPSPLYASDPGGDDPGL
jgi:hypothetical protein